MQYQVFIQNQAERQFMASIVGMPAITGEGTTEEEALAKASAALQAQLATGKLVTIQVGTPNQPNESVNQDDPWLKHQGLFADDPTFEDFLLEVAAYRQQLDAEAEAET